MRVFIAFEIELEIRKGIYDVLAPVRKKYPEIKWILPELYHLTLKFLGEVRENQPDEIWQAIQDCQKRARLESMSVVFHSVGAFPNPRRPRIIWVDVQAPANLSEFSVLIENSLEGMGFSKEIRDFSPHLTVGRVKDGKVIQGFVETVTEYSKVDFAESRLETLALVQSNLSPRGPSYLSIRQMKVPSYLPRV